jgi:purine catabolism regulator
VCGWLAVRHRVPLSATDRLVVNQTAGLVTLQLDWPAELLAAYRDLGGTLLALLLDRESDTGLSRHLKHFGFDRGDDVTLAVVPGSRRRRQTLDQVAAELERAKRPHVLTAIGDGVVVLVLERDAPRLAEVIVDAAVAAGHPKAVVGVSGPLSQARVPDGLHPARLAASAARRDDRRIGWFAELTLSAVLADDAVRSRVWGLAEPAMSALWAEAGRADLLPSLETFLHHNGSWEAAARSLGVHRHTLRARIAKVEEITGLSVDVAENRVLLMLALMSRPTRTVAPGTDSG